MELSITVTENGAPSLPTTGSKVLDFFFKVLRNTPTESTESLLSDAWAESQLLTLKAIFHLRDCRGGKGERKQFITCLRWLINENKFPVSKLIPLIPEYGSYKDVFSVCLDTNTELSALRFYAQQLIGDHLVLKNPINTTLDEGDLNDQVSNQLLNNISLAAKWAPTEGGELDRKHDLVAKLMANLKMCGMKLRCKKDYRKFITPLRKHLNIVERNMCLDTWSDITYSNVPSVAMNRHRKAFEKHDAARLKEFLEDVKSGKNKINAGQLFPHQLIQAYLPANSTRVKSGPIDDVVEAQWKTIVSNARSNFNTSGMRALPMVDVSSSMSWVDGVPMVVAVSLGLLMAEISDAFPGSIMTFTDVPSLFKVDLVQSLQEKVAKILTAPVNQSTDFLRALDLLLDTAVTFNVPESSMPTHLFVFSDMQFNDASNNYSGDKVRTTFELLEKKYQSAGYTRPSIVFWNLRGDTKDYPVCDNVPNVSLVSGFSQSLMGLFSSGIVATPMMTMLRALDGTRYDPVEKIFRNYNLST